MAQEFNRSPYFDDYTSENNFTQVLFRDGYPIQSRELNNVQSTFQDSIRKFGDHIFLNGSRVSNARCRDLNYDYIVVESNSIWDYLKEGVVLLGEATKLRAVVILSLPYNNQIFLSYKGTAIDGETKTFIRGESISVIDSDGNTLYTLKISCPNCGLESKDIPASTDDGIIGRGSVFTIDEGVFYFNGMFLKNEKQSIVLNALHTLDSNTDEGNASFDIGFYVEESIITVTEDVSLFDNSLGYPNKASSGADRHKIKLRLAKRISTDKEDTPFILLASYNNNILNYMRTDSDYSVILDTIAKRTFEESGNYTVRQPDVRFIEAKASYVGDPKGYSVNGSDDNYAIVSSPFISYVSGYRYNSTLERFTVTPKARDTKKTSSYINQFEDLSYILLSPAVDSSAYANSTLTIDFVYDGSEILLYDGPVLSGGGGTFLPSGAVVGTMKIFDSVLESGKPNTVDAVYRYYFYDLQFSTGKSFSDVKSVFHATNKFIADPVLEDGIVKIRNKGRSELIWKLKKTNIKSLRDSSNPEKGSIALTRRVKLTGNLDSQGTITFTPGENEIFSPVNGSSVAILTTSGVPKTIDLADFTVTQTQSSLRVDLTPTNAGKYFVMVTNSILLNSKERSKKVLTQTDTITVVSDAAKMILTKADVKKIISVIAYPKISLGAVQSYVSVDIKKFIFDNGQTDIAYKNGSLQMIAGEVYPETVQSHMPDYNLLVEYEYYEHSSGKGVFTVDSYSSPIKNGKLTYSTIPTYTSSSGIEYNLTNCFDFRPLFLNSVLSQPLLPAFNELSFFDLEVYLPRTDIFQVDRYGNLSTKLGLSSDTPVPPKPDVGNMALFELWISAYTHTLEDIKFKRLDTKRYTMRDIGRLESRLKKVEYYTVLNLLERSAADMSIKDLSGLDRFKNGFIADNFSNFQAADVYSPEFRAALDRNNNELRPSFGTYNFKLIFDPTNSSHYKITNKMISLPYTSEVGQEQPFATKHISVNPYFMWTREGNVTLTPNVDTWVSTTKAPDLVLTQDFGSEAWAGMTNRLNSDWGSWKDTNVTSRGVLTSAGAAANVANGNPIAGSRVENYNFGNRLTDISLTPWMRETEVMFDCKNMTPDTVVFAFFDDKPVSDFCRPAGGNFGAELKTDSSGNLSGQFRIPGDTFRVGDKKFKITGDRYNTDDPDSVITFAMTSFFAGGIDQTTQQVTLNATFPTFNYTAQRSTPVTPAPVADDWAGEKTVNTFNTVNNVITLPAPPPVAAVVSNGDPVAQSFTMEQDCFISKIDLFFYQKDPNSDMLWVEIRMMENGYPTDKAIGRKEFPVASIIVSKDSTVPHPVELDFPIFVKGNEEYCFVVGGASPNTRIWVAKTGGVLINDPSTVVQTQPSPGSSFRSQNGSTWNAEQFEDIKYKLYVANFTELSMTLSFNVEVPVLELEPDSLEFQPGVTAVRVYVKDHGASVGDSITVYPLNETKITVTSATEPKVNDPIVTSTGSALAHVVKHISGTTYQITLWNIQGKFDAAQSFTCGLATGTISTGTPTDINGILLQNIAKSHIVTAVDSSNTLVFNAANAATTHGKAGGKVRLECNVRYDVINASGSYMKYDCKEDWTFEGVSCNNFGSTDLLADYSKISPRTISLNSDIHLAQPYKLLTTANEVNVGTNVFPKTAVRATLSSIDNFRTPVIYLDSLSVTLIANRVGQESSAMNIAPNSVARYVSEADPINGVETFKYVTRKVTLAKPSHDLYILFTAWKDDAADFDLFYRVQSPQDESNIDTISWIPVPFTKTSNQWTEYEITLSEIFSSTWALQDVIGSFQIKIVGRTLNSASPPLFKDLRIIATS